MFFSFLVFYSGKMIKDRKRGKTRKNEKLWGGWNAGGRGLNLMS